MNTPIHLAARFTAVICLVAELAACHGTPLPGGAVPAPLAASPSPARPRSSMVAVGDTLNVVVLEDPSLNGELPVLESGNIILPKLGRVHAAGSTLAEVQNFVRERVQSDQIKKATVIVERVRRSEQAAFSETPKMLVFITGAVARPGQHRIAVQNQGGLTVFEALLIAGGPTQFADQRRSYILRKSGDGQRFRIPVDLRAVSMGEARDPQLQESDVIFVPGRRFGL